MHKFDPRYDLPVRNVLLATDFSAASGAAFHAALQISSVFNAKLHILNVCEQGTIHGSEQHGKCLDLDSLHQTVKRSLNSLIQQATCAGIPCDGKVVAGVSHLTILKTADSQPVDLIVLGTRPIHGFERLVFGSTAEAVIRQANCPVVTVGPQALGDRSPRGIIVFATDFHRTTLNAIYSAVGLSKRMHLPLHCLNVLPRGLEDSPNKGIIPLIISDALRHLIYEVDGETIPPVCAVTYGSEVSSAVVGYAKEHNARLVVLGVRRSSLAASRIPAQIVYRIIAEASCPVLTKAYVEENLDRTSNTLGSGLLAAKPRRKTVS
jgi:nucleotide-binding universal stress UspA family protein